MKKLHTSAWALAALLPCRVLGGEPPAGWVIGWGDNTVGQATGVPSPFRGVASPATGAVMIAGHLLTNAVTVAAGELHSLALTADGRVVGWGANGAGEAIGYDVPHPYGTSGEVKLMGQPLSDVVAIAAGRADCPGFSLALRRDGKVVAWGDNRLGQTAVPDGLSNVVAIAAGAFEALALKADGTVVSWGQGYPPPPGLTNVIAISAADMYGHNLALTRDGRVVDWWVGSSRYDLCTVPAGLSNVVALSAGWNHSLALKRDGTVVGWGFNGAAQATGVASVPPEVQATGTVMVAGQVLTNVVAIAAAHEFSLALRRDGTLAAWGGQASGVAITPPAGLSNVVAISASGYFCLAITTNAAPFAFRK
jgi:alpha-tubulin suppressor-like RCC1 family protein